MKIKTTLLKESVSKAIKGARMNSLIPMTSLMGIIVKDDDLILCTTDMINDLNVYISNVDSFDFSISVDADKFYKLISKLTSEYTVLDIKENILIIKADGTYKIAIVTDDSGRVEFNTIDTDGDITGEINCNDVKQVYSLNKNSVAKTLEAPYLTSFYCNDKVITSDSIILTISDFNLFREIPNSLISSEMIKLITLIDEDTAEYSYESNTFTITSSNIVIKGKECEGLNEYPINTITQLMANTKFNSNCIISKNYMLSVLDRLSLFIESYDNSAFNLNFGNNGITVVSRGDSSDEIIKYIDSENITDFNCLINIDNLKSYLNSISSDTIKIYYGSDGAIKFKDKKSTTLIALMSE